MDSLISLDGLSDVANNLIDKLASAAGWLVNRKTPKKIALDTYIKDIQESDLQPLEKAALISNSKKTIKTYCNQSNIVNIAIQNLEIAANPEKLDDDWIALFMDKAGLVSSEEFQLIWGKVLAYECNNPDSIPKVLLNILSVMDKKDAEAFTALSNLSVQVDDEFAPVINHYKLDEYKKWGITLDYLVDLKSLGLIEMDSGITNGYSLVSNEFPAKVTYFDLEYQMQYTDTVSVGVVLFTKSGMALRRMIQAKKIDGFWEKYCLPQFKIHDRPKEEK
ncbi:MAG: DUF2806 domain-containing protein [Clostridiales bacterium]|nr:DUF2806 domain-containing protein [Clostridiales bacterium]